ncbi:hypothetical protein NDU88_004251 [Pleurodeles waltl]|uniref:Uncharacterized protein n=1 Tax=Pleurodeles waltl TaxID=8319 RepID=A0AAV7W8I4_PLEWA|nr:hypothetical protein NDU88_004251 [Pleurodeles waltl]
MLVLDFPDDMDGKLTNISQKTLQDVLATLQTPPSVTRRSRDAAAITEDPHTTPVVRPATSNPAEDSDDTGTTFERTVVGIQRELAKEVWVGMQNMAASLEGMHMCMMSSAEQSAAMQAQQSLLQGLQQCVRDFTTAVRELPQHLASQLFHCVHECNHDPLGADLVAYHSDVAAILKNQQLLLAAVMPLIAPQLAATGYSDSTSSNTEVCVFPSNPPLTRAEETTHIRR